MKPDLSDASARPSRLPLAVHAGVIALCCASFVSGALVWLGQISQAQSLETPAWLHPALVTHGALFPVMCILFGYLLCQHIRSGWELRANIWTGLLLEGTFIILIATGAGLYYVGGEEARALLVWIHRAFGLLFPMALVAHWVGARVWVGHVEGKKG